MYSFPLFACSGGVRPIIIGGSVENNSLRQSAGDADEVQGHLAVLRAGQEKGACSSPLRIGAKGCSSNGIDGLLVAPSDLDGLVEALELLIDDPVLRARIAKSGRQRILKDYDLCRNVEKLAAIFTRRVTAQ